MKEVITAISINDNLRSYSSEYVEITGTSNTEILKCFKKLAVSFTKELNFGPSPDYLYGGAIHSGRHFIFIDTNDNHIYGGCSFGQKFEGMFVLEWIWIQIDYRRQGRLQKIWSEIRSSLGEFGFSLPISSEMKQFLNKNNLDDSTGNIDRESGYYLPFYQTNKGS